MPNAPAETPESLSIVLPVHNEQEILEEQVCSLAARVRDLGRPVEILLVENGSTDRSPSICRDLARRHPEIRCLSLPRGDYGEALRRGILEAENELVGVFNIEFWDVEFLRLALEALRSRSLVVGSKAAFGAHDERPAIRRLTTRSYNFFLKTVFGFRGTDTHGMKAFRKRPLAPLARACVTDGFVFDTELVLRAERADIPRMEIPTDVRELRAPSRGSLLCRVPSVIKNLLRLFAALNLSPKRPPVPDG